MEFRLRLGLLKGGDFIFLSPSRFVFSLKQIQDFLDDFFVKLFFCWGGRGNNRNLLTKLILRQVYKQFYVEYAKSHLTTNEMNWKLHTLISTLGSEDFKRRQKTVFPTMFRLVMRVPANGR